MPDRMGPGGCHCCVQEPWICSSIGCYGRSCYGPGTGQVCVHVCMVQYVAYLHLHGVCSVRSWRVYSVGCILTEASMDGGVTLSVMSSGKCISRTGSPSSPHLIPLHPHTSSPHLIPTPHPHTSSPQSASLTFPFPLCISLDLFLLP